MKSKIEKCKENECVSDNLEEIFINNPEVAYEKAMNCEKCFEKLALIEKSLFLAFKESHHKYSNDWSEGGEYSSFQEELDLQKADRAMHNGEEYDLPVYLQKYMESSFQYKKQAKDSITVKLGKQGLKLINSIFGDAIIPQIPQVVPAFRTAALLDNSSCITLQERTNDNNQFIYQIIRENPDEVYLSIKFDNSSPKNYDHVNLKKNNRFVFSSTVNRDGIVTFSGLKEGAYHIEFVGKYDSKAFDLSIFEE
ncbi:MAG: hypothetical protein H7A23_22055 [Leptospiraceae bacterium]|nr:hypothetical protein [Leptospiraceae bacterium]MCP5497245.1 hypothetical protein [Leptospiraceae bacterium]